MRSPEMHVNDANWLVIRFKDAPPAATSLVLDVSLPIPPAAAVQGASGDTGTESRTVNTEPVALKPRNRQGRLPPY